MKDPRRRSITDLERIEQNVADLLSRVDEIRRPIQGWQWRQGRHIAPGRYKYDSPWKLYSPETAWGGEDTTAWFRAEVAIPREMSGREVYARLLPGGEGIVRVNGVPVAGLDFSHTEFLLAKRAAAGQRFLIELECYFRDAPDDSIRGEVRKIHQFKIAELVVKDAALLGLYYDLSVAADMVRAMEQARPDLSARFLKAAQRAVAMLDPYAADPRAYRAGALAARKYLAESLYHGGHGRPAGTLSLVGACHLDLLFVWPYRESIRKNLRTNLIAAGLMSRYKEYRFGQTQAKLFDDMKRYHPGEFAGITALVRSGRFEPIGDMWVEPDANIPSGEALVRQILYGRKFFEKEFGRRSTVCWWSDVFGVTASLPQILVQAGYRVYYSAKHSVWHDTNEFPHGTFWWEGIDGTRIMAHFPPTHFIGRMDPESLALQWDLYQQKDEAPHVIYTYGFGDGGGGPTERMIEYARRLRLTDAMPQMVMSTAEEFAGRLTSSAHDLPVWSDELYLEMHRGAQTTRGDLKAKNRRAESALRAAEIMSSVAAAFAGAKAPHGEFEAMWKTLLECHFHDAVTGTHCTEAGQEVAKWYDGLLAAAGKKTLDACRAIAPKHAAGRKTLFNFTGAATAGHVFWNQNSPAGKKSARPLPDANVTLAAGGEVFQTQRLADGSLVTYVADLPALGHRVLSVVRAKAAGKPPFEMTARGIRSRHYELSFGRDGFIERLFDLGAGREVLAGPGNEFRLYEDKPGRFEAWEISKDYETRPIDSVRFLGAEDGACGALLATRILRWRVGNSQITQEVVLYDRSRRIDFRTEVDWREERKLLRVYFPLAVLARRATYEIAFGAIDRPTRTTNPYDKAKFEVPFHRWFDAGEHGYGVSILNDSKYGGCVKDSVASLSLLKAPRFPDPTSDLGKHTFTYSLLPHEGDWRDAGTFEEAFLLNTPFALFDGAAQPPQLAYVQVSRRGVSVEAFKRAENGKGWILRLVDYFGQAGPVTVTLPVRPKSVESCTVMEEASDGPVSPADGGFSYASRPFGIRTFRLTFAR